MSNGNASQLPVSASASTQPSPAAPRVSHERVSPPGRSPSARIRKKRISAGTAGGHSRAVSTASASASPRPPPPPAAATLSTPNGGKAVRRSSIRNAVRRIFGRRTSTYDQSDSGTTPSSPAAVSKSSPVGTSRHSHATSDPSALRPIPEQSSSAAVPTIEEPRTADLRTTSIDFPDNQSLRQARSPYAVEFPQSSRLKPLDLGNPFHRNQSSSTLPSPGEIKRRATLPSVVIDKDEAAALAKAIRINDDDDGEDLPDAEEERPKTAIPDNDIGVAVTTPMNKHNRRSRSADDLRRLALSLHPVRPRGEEIQFWRQSVAGNMPWRQVPGTIDTRDVRSGDPMYEVSPISGHDDVFTDAPAKAGDEVSPIHDSPVKSRPATAGGDSELERRVDNLEAGLATFQSALDRLAAQQNRRTIIIDNASSPRISRQNTPSILVNSLLDADFRYSGYSSAIQDAYTTDPPESADAASRAIPFTPQGESRGAPWSPNRSVSNLYSILNHERNARRTLEGQVRELQQTLSDMQDQLSQPIIRRQSPAYRPSQAGYQHFSQNPHMRQSSRYSDHSAHHEQQNNRLTSRFSTSESLTDSEAARLRESREVSSHGNAARGSYDELPTPVNMHAARNALHPGEGEMF